MGVLDLLWLFLMASALQPLLKQRMLDASRQRMIGRIERARGSRVILLVHRQETMSFLGFPFFRYIDINDSEEVLRAIDMTDPELPLDIVLHTPGGLVLASLQIASAIHKRPGKVTVYVPHFAMSGGTLIALAADEIVMSPHAVLGPVDPQLAQHPGPSILRVLEKKPIERIDDQTIMLADQAEKAISQVSAAIKRLLRAHLGEDRAAEVARLLTQGTWTHDHPLMFEDLAQMGLPVSAEMPREFMKLMEFYPQPIRRQPSVEYLPVPRRAGRGRGQGRKPGGQAAS